MAKFSTVGYSDVIDSPEFIAEVDKRKKKNNFYKRIFTFMPIVILPIISIFVDELDMTQAFGLGVGITILLCIFYFFTDYKANHEKSWDGVVESKERKMVRVIKKAEEDDKDYWEDRDYITFRLDNGKKKVVEERTEDSNSLLYDYFEVGDRLRYHAQMGLLFPYEKYDKSKDTYRICPFCFQITDLEADTCPRCHGPLLK